MTLKKVLEKVMVALDEAESENLSLNMADYKNKIYECVDSCQRELAVFIDNILKTAEITVSGGAAILPDDCFDINALYKGERQVSYERVTEKQMLAADGSYTLRYSAYPQRVNKNTSLEYELEVSKEAQEALIYGVCAGLCINDEPELYAVYMDRYNGLCQGITERKMRYPKASVRGGVRL